MKALAVSVVCFLLVACMTTQVAAPPPEVVGTFDLVTVGNEPVPNSRINKLWVEFTALGTWELFQEPRGTGSARGLFEVGERVGGCLQVEMWLYADPGGRSPMEFCDGVMNWYAYHNLGLASLRLVGPMIFHKRR